MIRILSTIFLLTFLCSCEQQQIVKTPEMAAEAKSVVLAYLSKNQLPHEGLEVFNSAVRPKPDFSFLYKGAGRCIEFIINCNGQNCKEMRKYPYDEHGEKCP